MNQPLTSVACLYRVAVAICLEVHVRWAQIDTVSTSEAMSNCVSNNLGHLAVFSETNARNIRYFDEIDASLPAWSMANVAERSSGHAWLP